VLARKSPTAIPTGPEAPPTKLCVSPLASELARLMAVPIDLSVFHPPLREEAPWLGVMTSSVDRVPRRP